VFNLRHALLKLTSEHRQFDCLIRFAHSPRLQAPVQSNLTIICVQPPHPRVVSLPQSVTDWKTISKAIVPDCDSVGGKWRANEAESLAKAFGQNRPIEVPVHCECLLVSYFTEESRLAMPQKGKGVSEYSRQEPAGTPFIKSTTSPKGQGKKSWNVVSRKRQLSKKAAIVAKWRGVPPFSYIGVSKLSCNACQIWMAGYNRQPGQEFYTRGTHGKWYWPWGISPTDEGVLSQYLVDEVSTAYYEFCRSQHRVKRTSDGSNAETYAQPRHQDEKDDKFILSHRANSRV